MQGWTGPGRKASEGVAPRLFVHSPHNVAKKQRRFARMNDFRRLKLPVAFDFHVAFACNLVFTHGNTDAVRTLKESRMPKAPSRS